VLSLTPRPLYPKGRSLRYPLEMRLCGNQSQSACCGEKKNILPLTGIELRFPGRPESGLIGVPVRAASKEVRVHSASCTVGTLSHASLVLPLTNHWDNHNFSFTSNIKFRVNQLGAFGVQTSRKMVSHYLLMLCSSCPEEVRSASWPALPSGP
jgi:hypothetical protein